MDKVLASKSIIDVDAIVRRHVKNTYIAKDQKLTKVPWDDLHVRIDKTRLLIETTTPSYKSNDVLQGVKPHTLFKTTFNNPTDREQIYKLNTERTTSQICSMMLTKGFTNGLDMSCNVSLPGDMLNLSAGFKREVRLDETREKCTEEVVTWTLDRDVIVPPRTRTIAEMVVEEVEYRGDFKMESVFSGEVVVTMTKKNGEEISHTTIKDLHSLLCNEEGFEPGADKNKVKFVSEGRVYMKTGVEQKVFIREEPLES